MQFSNYNDNYFFLLLLLLSLLLMLFVLLLLYCVHKNVWILVCCFTYGQLSEIYCYCPYYVKYGILICFHLLCPSQLFCIHAETGLSCLNQVYAEDKVSGSGTRRSASSEAQTHIPLISSQALHCLRMSVITKIDLSAMHITNHNSIYCSIN